MVIVLHQPRGTIMETEDLWEVEWKEWMDSLEDEE